MSWRMGECVTADPLCRWPKVCSMDCIYCRHGTSSISAPSRTVFVNTDDFKEELANVPPKEKTKMLWFFGNGEPALAMNIKEMIQTARMAGFKRIAVLTNSTLLNDPSVREDLKLSDILIAKLDASQERTFQRVNRPFPGIDFKNVLEGLHRMRREYRGSFRIHVTLIDENQKEVDHIADLCKELQPETVYLSTPRLSNLVSPLPRKVMAGAGSGFRKKGMNVLLENPT